MQKRRVRELPVLRKSAQWAPCCFSCDARNQSDLVLAHNNELRLGRGSHFKTPDYYGAIVCSKCHDLIDGRNGKLTMSEKREMHRLAHEKTLSWWFEDGWLVAKEGVSYANVPF